MTQDLLSKVFLAFLDGVDYLHFATTFFLCNANIILVMLKSKSTKGGNPGLCVNLILLKTTAIYLDLGNNLRLVVLIAHDNTG